VESILGPEDHEEEWFQDSEELVPSPGMSESSDDADDVGSRGGGGGVVISTTSMTRRKLKLPRSPLAKAKVQRLDTTGDECGGEGRGAWEAAQGVVTCERG
jgi:hypothetical protein